MIIYSLLNVINHKLTYNQRMKKKAMTPTERKRKEVERKKAMGLVNRGVWAHPDDWPKIRKLEAELKQCRLKEEDE